MQGADTEKTDGQGWTALFFAVEEGHLEMVQWLVREGRANDQHKDQRQRSPLLLAANRGHVDIVEWLVCQGAVLCQIEKRVWQSSRVLAALTAGLHARVRPLLLPPIRGALDWPSPLHQLVADYALPTGWQDIKEALH
eukprot:g48839.t1